MKRALFLSFLLLFGCSSPPLSPPMPPFVSIAQVEQKKATLYAEYVGHIEANQSVKIRSQVEGVILQQHFIEGSEVLAGDPLLTIDPRPFQALLSKAEGNLAFQMATLKQAEDRESRYSKLVVERYISELEYDQTVTDVSTAAGALQEALADVERAKINLEYCFIKAPISGVTSKLAITVGNYVPIGGDPLLLLNEIHPIRVSAYIPEKDLPLLAALQKKGVVKTTAFLNPEIFSEGTLFLINNQVEEETGTILIQALFENADDLLWPGEFVSLRVILEEREKGLVIPAQAIQIGQEGPFIFVLKEDRTVELRKISIAQKEGDFAILDSGVSQGEWVITEGQMNLVSGSEVIVRS